MVDLLLFVSSDGIDQIDQVAIEEIGGLAYQLGLGLFALVITRVCILGLLRQLTGLLIDPAGINSIKQAIDDTGQLYAFCGLFDSGLVISASSCLFNRASRPARELTVSVSLAPIITPMARSLSATEGLVISG